MELIDEISLLVDNNLRDKKIAQRLTKIIDSDIYLKQEFLIQKSIKNLLTSRLSASNAPSCISDKLRYLLDDEMIKSNFKNRL